MGDYKTYGYAGDPGFLSSLWKGIKSIGKAVIGIPPRPPSPAGWPTVAAGGAAGYALQQQFAGPAAPQGIPGAGAYGPSLGKKFQFPDTKFMAAGAGCCPSGYHLAKDGSGRCVRNRRMNVANPRALRRSMRRVQGFEKLAKRTISFTRRVKMKK